MSWYWNPIGAVALAAGTLALALAATVLVARPDRFQNRALALLLFVEAFMVAGGGGVMYLTTEPKVAAASQLTGYAAGAASPWVYMIFLTTLPSRLAQPFRRTSVRVLLGVVAAGAALNVVLRPHLVFIGFAASPWSRLESISGPYQELLLVWPLTIASGIGLVAALHAWQTAAPATPARRQGGFYAAAFGVRDLGWLAYLVVAHLLPSPPLDLVTVLYYAIPMTSLGFAFLLAYGILQAHLFDIDLRIKWTISRSTVAGIILATFLVVSQLVENIASDAFGLFAGSVAAGLLLFMIQPLTRFADRVADTAMPRVQDSEEYRAMRQREVYRATLDELLADGLMQARERRALQRLQSALGLDAAVAQQIEIELLEAQGAHSSGHP